MVWCRTAMNGCRHNLLSRIRECVVFANQPYQYWRTGWGVGVLLTHPPYPRVHPRCSRSANSWLYKHQSICSCEHLGGEMEKKFSGPSHHCCCCKVRNLQGLEMITVNMCKLFGHVLEDTPGLPQGLPAASCCNYCRARGHSAEVCK